MMPKKRLFSEHAASGTRQLSTASRISRLSTQPAGSSCEQGILMTKRGITAIATDSVLPHMIKHKWNSKASVT